MTRGSTPGGGIPVAAGTTWHPQGVDDLGPIEQECMRCRSPAPMRFAGLCSPCRTTLHETFAADGRTIEIAAYEPKMNVTPNAVALKDD